MSIVSSFSLSDDVEDKRVVLSVEHIYANECMMGGWTVDMILSSSFVQIKIL